MDCNMSGYSIIHTDEYEPDFNKTEGRHFKNKDEVIDYLIFQLACISSDYVEVIKK